MKKLKNLVVTLGVSASLVTGFTFIAPTQKVSAADKSQVNLWAGEDFKSTRAIYVFPESFWEFMLKIQTMWMVLMFILRYPAPI